MCAIAGIWHPNQSNPTIVEKMTQCLAHRGPDAEGFWHDQYCSLGHRRLKIVDLSDSANQPMISSNGDWVMVFNGEIYNHSELARSFLTHHSFRTSSDTEVLLEGFATYGIDFVQHLKGIFALALYHLSNHTLWLVRDASGIKPLMYSFWEGGVAFGSEIKALLEVPRLNHSINNLALEQYLQLGYIPSPLTVYKAINKLSKGEVLRINHQGHELYNWQKKDISGISNQTPQDFLSSKEKLKETIKKL